MLIPGRRGNVLTLVNLPSRDLSRDRGRDQHSSTPHEGHLARSRQVKPRRFTCDSPGPYPGHQDITQAGVPLPRPPACCRFSQGLQYLALYSHCPSAAWHKRGSPCSVWTVTVPPVSCEATAAAAEVASFRFRYRLLSLPRMFWYADSAHQMCIVTASSRMVMKTSGPRECPSHPHPLPGVTMTRHSSPVPRHCLSMAMGRQAWCLHVCTRVMA
jgi:hypothetical protein